VDPHYVYIPVLLIHPFVERALTDGLLNRDRIGILTIAFNLDQDILRCAIKSKGIEEELDMTRPISRSPVGKTETWWEVHERIELLNKLYNTNIHVDLIGTLIQINVPLPVRPEDD